MIDAFGSKGRLLLEGGVMPANDRFKRRDGIALTKDMLAAPAGGRQDV
jgi:hypothetical protein